MAQNEMNQTEEIRLNTPEEIVLNSQFKDGFFKRMLFGFLYGLAIIIPGISGAAVSIIFKLYDELIYAVSNLFKRFKKCFLFLLPIVLGLLVGLLLGLLAVQKLLELLPVSIVFLFAGLMIGSFPAVRREIKGNKKDVKNSSFFLLGTLLPLIFLAVTVGLNFKDLATQAQGDFNDTGIAENFFKDFPIYLYFLAIPIGMIVGLTQVVPGLSASAFLMMVGWFNPLMDSLHRDYLFQNPKIFIVIAILIVSFLVGFFLTSKLIAYCTKKNRVLSYQFIVGLSLGSIFSMFANPEVMTIYLGWYYKGIVGTIGIVDVSLAAPLMILGIGLAYWLVRYEMKKTESIEK
jgi:hypothetical protein